MKARLIINHFCLWLLTLGAYDRAFAQGTAFTYQGRLNDSGSPADGSYDMAFSLFASDTGGVAIGGPVTNSAVSVTNGMFTTLVDFGDVFAGGTNWLQIALSTNGANAFRKLSPRQQLTPVPYAITAANVSGTIASASLAGIYGNAVTFNNSADSFAGDGTGLMNVNAASLNGLNEGSFWQLGGNNASPGQILGCTNNQPLDLYANGVRGLRLRLLTDGQGIYTNAPNVIGGSSVNLTAKNVVGATIAGGGGNSTNGNALVNEVYADFGTVGGGADNKAGSPGTTVSGGMNNTATNVYAMVGGGIGNNASGPGSYIGGGGFEGSTVFGNSASGTASVIGGGINNVASFFSATVAGGYGNSAGGSSFGAATAGGGLNNQATSDFATVSGGDGNVASGVGAFVGGGGTDGSTSPPFGLIDNWPNVASGDASVVGGGLGNTNLGYVATVAGGSFNKAVDGGAVVGGGSFNVANGAAAGYATVGGGLSNRASGGWATVGGGATNAASGNNATVAGGYSNAAGGDNATISGGYNNTASADFATVAGGGGNVSKAIGAFIGGGGYDGTTLAGNLVVSKAATIGGGLGNQIPTGSEYAVIAGGSGNVASGIAATVSGGTNNTASGTSANVGGGAKNTAGGTSATVGGGEDNTATGSWATVAGGANNKASNTDATVAGGGDNTASGFWATVAGGSQNSASGPGAAVAGGDQNSASGYAATVAGGEFNTATGSHSFAAGSGAKAKHDGSFVWSDDSSGFNFQSTTANQFRARATGGVAFVTAIDGTTGTDFAGVKLNAGDTSWNSISDRNAKKNFQPVDTVAVLNQLAAIPIERWNYKWESDTNPPHLGPMAQNFKAAFYPGRDDKSISTLEFDGVELAAIQGLNQKVEELKTELNRRDAENAELKQKNDSLEQRLAALERIIRGHQSN